MKLEKQYSFGVYFSKPNCNCTTICFSAKRDGVHKEFQKAIEAAVCRYVPDKGMLSVMVSFVFLYFMIWY